MHGRYEPTQIRERTFGGDEVLRDVGGYVPGPLPPDLPLAEVRARHFEQLMATTRALGHLSGQVRNLKNPAMLVSAFATREARSSSAIENTIANQTDLAVFELLPAPTDEHREVHNYFQALSYAFQSGLPVSVRLMKECHERLLRGSVRGRDKQPGSFRTTQNYVGVEGAGRSLTASYVPTPPAFLPDCIAALEEFANAGSELPVLVRIAMVHYQFEAIHPFHDGNGRVGRMLVAHQLCQAHLEMEQPLVYVSGFFEMHREEYIRLLGRVTTDGDWNSWIDFFLRAVRSQALDASRRAEGLLALRDEYGRRLTEGRASTKLLLIVDHLFSYPALNARKAVELTGVTDPMARKYLQRLTDEGILTPSRDAYNRHWLAKDIIRAIEEEYDDRGM